jgi:ER-bound oxygenase mpaB/B'/Rubber oxygenase, catalytic domain
MSGANGNSRWTDELLDRMRELGDPVADGPVAAVLERGGVDAVNALMQTLVRVDQLPPEQLPPELQDYLQQSLPVPEWADMAKIKQGQQIFEEWGFLIILCLFCASLPASYAAANGVKVLQMTARLVTDARRRVMETGQFLMDVLAVGGLDEEGKGRRTIQKVRLMHAAVRHLIKARNEKTPGTWQPEWGTPINQEDLAGSLLTFSYVVAEPLPRLGVRLSVEEVDAYLHLWNVIGHLQGVRDELLARDVSDATALVDAIRRRQFRPSPQGQELTRALLDLLDELTPLHRFDDTIPPLIRHLIGDETADLLRVPKSHLFDHLGPLARAAGWGMRVVGEIERDLPHYQVMSDMARPLGREVVRGIFALERGGDRAPFDIPDHLARDWELPA